MVRELFEMARSKKACLIFFDEIDAIGGARFDDGAGGDNEVWNRECICLVYCDLFILILYQLCLTDFRFKELCWN